MAKNKNGLEKDKKKKLPFNVLSKKGLATLALAGVMIASPLMLAGCSGEQGPKGNDGTNGSTWYSGTEYSASQGVIGDFFYDTDDFNIYQKTADGWTLISNIKGPQGEDGQDGITPTITINEDGYWVINGVPTTTKAQGPAGENGQNGTTPTISINDDGYWVINGDPTDVKAEAINGTNGEDGNAWSVGTEYPTTPNNGDMFLNNTTWEVYQYNGTSWESKGNIKGQDGQNGSNGTNGQDGISCYLGYDGYIWNGAERTEFSANANLGENVVENTIGIEGVMSKYFAGSYIDLSSNTIALMANYMPNAKLTQYSGTTVTEIKVYAESAGNLYIGTAKVADIVNARTNGTTYTSSTTSHEVTAGLNTITLNINVAEDETIVLGGQGSVGLYVVSGIPVNDEQGNFALLNNQENANLLSTNGTYADTLAVHVSAIIKTNSVEQVLENVEQKLVNSAISSSASANPSYAPFAYENVTYYAGSKIIKVGIPVKTLKDYNSDQVFTLYVIKQTTTRGFENNYVSKHELIIPANTYASNTINEWYYFDVSELDINVADDESLAFTSPTDTIIFGYHNSNTSDSTYHFHTTKTTEQHEIYIDVYVESMDEIDINTHIENLLVKEANAILENQKQALATALSGKNFSILGDSISTFAGVSNDSANTNSTIGSNAIWYDTELTVEQTWWSQIADVTDMNILVNNSYSGDTVANAKTSRCINLHDNTGNSENSNINPDIIAVYMGVNDIKGDANLSVETFKANYLTMIQNMKNAYADSDIFLFTIPQYTYGNSRSDEELDAYNNAIREIAISEGCKVVDLFANSGITKSSLVDYTIDNLHPNAIGMDLITDCFWNVLYETYITNANN